jgi:hypothetical protein
LGLLELLELRVLLAHLRLDVRHGGDVDHEVFAEAVDVGLRLGVWLPAAAYRSLRGVGA